MFPSTSNLGTNFFYSDNSNNSFDSTNPYNSSSFPIHSPYIFYEDDLQEHLHDFLQYQQQQQQQAVPPIVAHQEISTVTNINMNQNHTHDTEHVSINGLVQGSPTVTDDVVFCSTKKQIPRKRTSNRDRHSKINTAHGPRDRRMRLSLDVAQKFFGLQDMLGFDKASKTVQWLLTKSKTAIKKLSSSSSTTNNKGGINVPNTTSSSSTSNNSECEVLSGIIDESAASFSLPGEIAAKEKEKAKPAAAATREKKATPPSRGSRAFRPIAKEAREKARARARERTEEKRSIRLGNVNHYDHQSKKIPCIVGIDQNLNQNSASWVPFEAAGEEESSTIQIGKEHPSFPQADHQEPSSRTTSLQHEQDINVNGGHSNLFTTEGNWNPSPAFNYHHNAAISHEDSFTEVQYFGKPWG